MDSMETIDLGSASVPRSKSIYHDIRNILTLPRTDYVFPEIPRNNPFPFKIIKAMWPDRYYELSELWKTEKKRYEETSTFNNEQQYQRYPYKSMLQSQYGLNLPSRPFTYSYGAQRTQNITQTDK